VYHILTDEDIVESVIKEKKMEGSDVEMELEEEPVDVPTDQEALQGLETVIGWLEAQQDVEQVKIMQLVLLKNMILKKRFSHKNNKKLLTF
jgi:radical SAM superfamily enzyme